MKQLFTTLLVFFILTPFVTAQTNKVNWKAKTNKIDDKTFQVEFTADISDGWYIYSQYIEDGGPVPTDFDFSGDGFRILGQTEEESDNTKEAFDSTFNIQVKKFGGKVTFKQVVLATSDDPTLSANVTFMSCNDEMCLPPREVKIPISLK